MAGFDGTLKFDTAIDKTGFQAGLSKLGSIAQAGMKAIGGAALAGTAAVAALGRQALLSYADYEQLVGGVETLFGAGGRSLDEYADSVGASVDAARAEYDRLMAAQEAVLDNAAAAFRTSGLSQNAYMETVTSFSAALIASLGGDTAAAAQIADTAIIDMADNANKMGSSMESIQNAYQGFAKQNYTMLDNLKLGYGGTKSEMERLLADAQAISGVQYDITSYADVVQAIHTMQDALGISGTTSREAAGTISGSLAAMRAAWDNLLVGVSDDTQDFDTLTQDLIESAVTAADNILPRVEIIGEGVVQLVSSLGDSAVQLLTDALTYLPDLVAAGISLVEALVQGLTDNAPTLADAGLEAAGLLIEGIASAGAMLLSLGAALLTSLADGITQRLPQIMASARSIVQTLGNSLRENLPLILSAGLTLLTALVQILTENLPLIIGAAVQIVDALTKTLVTPDNIQLMLDSGLALLTAVTDALLDNLPLLLDAAMTIVEVLVTSLVTSENIEKLTTTGLTILIRLVNAITDNIDRILAAAETIIMALVDELSDPSRMEQMTALGIELLGAILNGLIQIAGKLIPWAWELHWQLWDAIAHIDWGGLGRSVLDGIIEGLNGVDWTFFTEFKDNFVTGLKDIFGIHSPSKLMEEVIGRNLSLGIGVGFTDAMPDVAGQAAAALASLDMPRIPLTVRTDPAMLSLLRSPLPQDTGLMQGIPGAQTGQPAAWHTAQPAAPPAQNAPPVTIHATLVVGEEVIAEGVADRIDREQGITVLLQDKGVSV